MIDKIEIKSGVWVLEEDGQNVLLTDCQRFRIGKHGRLLLLGNLLTIAGAMKKSELIEEYIDAGILKKLEKQPKARDNNLWEIRDEGRALRLIFVRQDPDSIIVSAVSKLNGSLSEAINRGANRWIKYQKGNEK